MENNKKTVVYARTSTKKQNYELQLEAAKPFLRGIQEENLTFIVDHGAPATSKLKGLQQLIDLIKKGQVDTLIIYKRDRLIRSEVLLQRLQHHESIKITFAQIATRKLILIASILL